MRRVILAFTVIINILISGCVTTGNKSMTKTNIQIPDSFQKRIVKTVGCSYLVYLPTGYTESKEPWPMIFFLHGSGESGDKVEDIKMQGLPKILDNKKDFPFIVISPQCPDENEAWQDDVLINLLDEVEHKYRVDKDRVYLTGLSMGGDGTWKLAIAYPERFAAIAPICGEGNIKKVARLKNIPVWVFHGAKDPVVPVKESEDLVNELKKIGGDVRFTVYPELKHNSWSVTYDNPELYKWFLEHRKSKN